MSNHSVIKDLVQTLEDGRKGFADAADSLADDGNTQLAEQFRSYSQQRAEFAEELRTAATEAGESIDEDGSIAGALHRGWISMKDALTGDSAEAVVKAAESGEEHAVSEYEDALEDDDLDASVRTLVERQAGEIRSAHQRLKELADAS